MIEYVDNVVVARRYVEAIETGVAADVLSAFFDPDVAVQELPNRLYPQGQTRGRDRLLADWQRSKGVVSGQRYQVLSAIGDGDSVVMELDWSATILVPLGATPVGGRLHARLAMFLTFRNGRITSQRNYDCYDPF